MQELTFEYTKLSEAMEIIEQAAALMAEKDCEQDKKAKGALEHYQQQLRTISGNDSLQIKMFAQYWGWTSLETAAKKALLPPPLKADFADDEIREIVLSILDHEEAEMDWWLDTLKVSTHLDNLTDYIFYPDEVGLDAQATLNQIAEKILADRR